MRKNYVIAQRVKSLDEQHIYWSTISDNKNIRLNSRDYASDAEDTGNEHSAVQIKPNVSVGGDDFSICGLEASPRFAAGIAGLSLIGIKADPLLKAGAGNLAGQVAAVQANIDFGISGTRTIAEDIAAFESFLAIPSTYTYDALITFLRIRSVNIKAWDAFLNLDDTNTGCTQDSEETGGSSKYLKVYIGDKLYTIAMTTGS